LVKRPQPCTNIGKESKVEAKVDFAKVFRRLKKEEKKETFYKVACSDPRKLNADSFRRPHLMRFQNVSVAFELIEQIIYWKVLKCELQKKLRWAGSENKENQT